MEVRSQMTSNWTTQGDALSTRHPPSTSGGLGTHQALSVVWSLTKHFPWTVWSLAPHYFVPTASNAVFTKPLA